MRKVLVGYTYRGYEMAYALERAREFGYQGIELRDFRGLDLSSPEGIDLTLKEATALAGTYGLRVESLFYAPLPVSREEERASEEAAFVQVVGLLARYGVPVLHTRLGLWRRDGSGEVVSTMADDTDYAAVRRTLGRVGNAAEQQGVRIALETHMGTIHDTAAAQLRIVRECGSPAVTASLDFANMLIENREENLQEVIRAFGSLIGYVHLKNLKLLPQRAYDWNLPLRWGDINYHPVLQALTEAGYRGPLAVEYCGTGDPDVFAEDDAAYLQQILGRLGGASRP